MLYRDAECEIDELLVPMRDGVRLYTRCLKPAGEGKYPTVFMRTPYPPADDKILPADPERVKSDIFYKNGYAVVLQYVRGVSASEGQCIPYMNERNDGLDTLGFIRSREWYNGEIYVTGASYCATVHLAYLDTSPADIKGAALSVQTDNIYGRDYENGCCCLMCNAEWVLSMTSKKLPAEEKNVLAEKLKTEKRVKPYWSVMERTLGRPTPYFSDRLLHPEPEADIWSADKGMCAAKNAITDLRIPTLFTEGWYDFYQNGMLSMWERLPEETKRVSAMFLGPWGHSMTVAQPDGLGMKNGELPGDRAVKWFNCLRDGTPYPYAETGKLNYYVMNADRWERDVYPVKTDKYDVFTLSGLCGRDELSYRYDPDDPAYLDAYKLRDQSELPAREDTLTFTTKPFEMDTEYYGCVRLPLCVKSDCGDTAFFARLSVINGSGVWNVGECLGALSYYVKDYRPGSEAVIPFEMPLSAFRVGAGDRLRLVVTSSNASRFVPHSNIPGLWSTQTESRVALNTVVAARSALELPRRNAGATRP